MAQADGGNGARFGVPVQQGLHVYAHCLRGTPGGVALLLINTDQTAERTLSLAQAGERYTLTAGSAICK